MTNESGRRLGRGLDALLGDYTATARPGSGSPAAERLTAPLAFLHPNPRNPRREFAGADLDELSDSIRTHGLVQPIVVRAMPGRTDAYEIIAGERRWRAAQKAGLHDVPIAVMDVSDRQALELAIVENVQRTDLNPVEEALGYQALIEEFSYSQADLGEVIGKSRAHVTNTLRLLKLPEPVLAALRAGTLSAGHARALVTVPDAEALAKRVIAKGLSVRETERLAQRAETGAAALRKPARAAVGDADTRALEREVSDQLGLAVSIRHTVNGSGEVRVKYASLDQLETICRKLRR